MKTIYLTQPETRTLKAVEKQAVRVVVWVAGEGEWRVRVKLVGAGSRCEVLGVFVGQDQDQQKFQVEIEHIGERTRAETKIRGVLTDRSSHKFAGMIRVAKTGRQTNSFLEEKALLLSELAHHETRPQLEIEADEVKASHASTTSQLDQEQLLYLMSRGLEVEAAERMLLGGFLGEVALSIDDEPVKRDIIKKINKLI